MLSEAKHVAFLNPSPEEKGRVEAINPL